MNQKSLTEVMPKKNLVSEKVKFYEHNLTEQDIDEIFRALKAEFISTGPLVKTFERKFANYMGSKHAVGLMSCTHGLELALRYYNIGYGDEIITTTLSFVATANVIEIVGAKLVFVDVEERTGNINVDLIEEKISSKTKAIIVVHLYGQMCDMVAIRKIADEYNLKIIEDCAHCIEGSRDGYRPGQLGDIAAYSFYATKNLTCGEGGAVTCNDEEIYKWMLSARQHGISKSAVDRYRSRFNQYDMNFLGLKCNMSDLQAALLVRQIDRLDASYEKRVELYKIYNAGLNNNIKKPEILEGAKSALHLYTILIPKNRDQFLWGLQEYNIGVSVHFKPIHMMSYYRKKYGYEEGFLPVAEKLGKMTLTLPFYPNMPLDEVNYVIKHVNLLFNS